MQVFASRESAWEVPRYPPVDNKKQNDSCSHHPLLRPKMGFDLLFFLTTSGHPIYQTLLLALNAKCISCFYTSLHSHSCHSMRSQDHGHLSDHAILTAGLLGRPLVHCYLISTQLRSWQFKNINSGHVLPSL